MPLTKPRDQHLLQDLQLQLQHRELRPVYRVDTRRETGPGGRGRIHDFVVVAGRDNLSQAVIMRLLTPRGELKALGHADYGSRIHELIGSGNTGTNRNLLKLFTLEALKREPRIEKVEELTVIPSPGRRSTVDMLLKIKPRSFEQVVTIGPFRIDLQ